MELLFFILLIIGVIVEIVSTVLLLKKKKNIYWDIVLGTHVGVLISAIIGFFVFSKAALDLSGWVVALFASGIPVILNFIPGLIGLISFIKNKYKLSFVAFIPASIIFVLMLIVVLLAPAIKAANTRKTGDEIVIQYLTDKYGNGNYKVLNVSNGFSYDGIMSKRLSSYIYEMKSDYMESMFIVRIDIDLNCISNDFFLPVYYSEKNALDYKMSVNKGSISFDFEELKKYIQDKYNITSGSLDLYKLAGDTTYLDYTKDGINYASKKYIVSPTNGKIPSLSEVVESLRNNK